MALVVVVGESAREMAIDGDGVEQILEHVVVLDHRLDQPRRSVVDLPRAEMVRFVVDHEIALAVAEDGVDEAAQIAGEDGPGERSCAFGIARERGAGRGVGEDPREGGGGEAVAALVARRREREFELGEQLARSHVGEPEGSGIAFAAACGRRTGRPARSGERDRGRARCGRATLRRGAESPARRRRRSRCVRGLRGAGCPPRCRAGRDACRPPGPLHHPRLAEPRRPRRRGRARSRAVRRRRRSGGGRCAPTPRSSSSRAFAARGAGSASNSSGASAWVERPPGCARREIRILDGDRAGGCRVDDRLPCRAPAVVVDLLFLSQSANWSGAISSRSACAPNRSLASGDFAYSFPAQPQKTVH